MARAAEGGEHAVAEGGLREHRRAAELRERLRERLALRERERERLRDRLALRLPARRMAPVSSDGGRLGGSGCWP